MQTGTIPLYRHGLYRYKDQRGTVCLQYSVYILCLVTDVLYRPDEAYDHMLSREYTWNVKNKATKGYEEMYFFLERGGQFCYNELETRVRLTKRRKTGNLAFWPFQ